MKITTEVTDFWALYEASWSGAKQVLDEIIRQGKEDELMALLEDIFYEGATDVEVNDFIWFEVSEPNYLNLYPEEEEED